MKKFLLRVYECIYRFLLLCRIFNRSRSWSNPRNIKREFENILVTGYFDEALGIGRGAQLTLSTLKSTGVRVDVSNLRQVSRKLLTAKALHFPAALYSTWLIHANAPEAELALFIYNEKTWTQSYRIAYWAWESSVAPSSWVRFANQFHEIWVPSAFVRDALKARFLRSNVPQLISNIKIMPHPVEVNEHLAVTRSELGIPENAFVGLVIFDGRSGYERKNPIGAVRAWCEAFPNATESARLVLKCHHADADSVNYEALLRAILDRDDIILMDSEISFESLCRFQKACDLLISLHRAEGFGLVLMEAMLLQTPVLATGWSGNLEFMCGFDECLVPYSLVPSTKLGGEWAEPDISTAALMLRRFFDEPDWRVSVAGQMQVHARKKAAQWKAQWIDEMTAKNSAV